MAEGRVTRIYVLRDPRTGEVRYVGKTALSLAGRMSAHRRDARGGRQTHSAKWIRALLRAGIEPIAQVIEEVAEGWAERERFWIAHFRAQGARLTNLADGGGGVIGWKMPPGMLADLRARVADPDFQARRAATLVARMADPEVRAKYLRTLDRLRTDPAAKERHRQATKAAQADPALRAHLAVTSKAAWTPERRAAQAAVARRVNAARTPEMIAEQTARQWTPERRAARADDMRRFNAANAGKLSGWSKAAWTPKRRAAQAARNRERAEKRRQERERDAPPLPLLADL